MLQSASKTFLRTQSDSRLTSLAAGGNEVAFAAIVERHGRLLKRACRRVLPEARVEDAVQQTFMSAWTALRRGDEIRELQPWLLQIARNTALNALRVRGYDYDVLRDSLAVGQATAAELERRDIIRSTLAGLAALPDSQREALLRSAVHGTPHAEIARDLGVSEGAVRQLVLRARASLRATATAVIPLPVVKWVAAAGQHGEPSTARIAELAAGAAPVGAGLAAVLVKGGAVVVIAGGAALTPAAVDVVDRGRDPKAAPAVGHVHLPATRAAEAGVAQPGGPSLENTGAANGDHDDDDESRDRDRDRDRDDDDRDEVRPSRVRPAVPARPDDEAGREGDEGPGVAAPESVESDEPDGAVVPQPQSTGAAAPLPATAPPPAASAGTRPAVAPDELAEQAEPDGD